MNIFNNLDIVYEILLKLNYFERLPLNCISHNFNQIVKNIDKNWDIEKDLFNKYDIQIILKNYKIRLPFVDNFYQLLKKKYLFNFRVFKIYDIEFTIYESGCVLYSSHKNNFYDEIIILCDILYDDGFLKNYININDIKIIETSRKLKFNLGFNYDLKYEKDIKLYYHQKFLCYKYLNCFTVITPNFDLFFNTFKILLQDINKYFIVHE